MTAPRLLVLADDLIWATRLEGQGRTLGAEVRRFTAPAPLLAALATHPATPINYLTLHTIAMNSTTCATTQSCKTWSLHFEPKLLPDGTLRNFMSRY